MQRAIFCLMSLVFVFAFVSFSAAEVFLTEDFEDEAKYGENWVPTDGWSLVKAELAGKESTVLDVDGGEIGLSVKNDFADFEMEADFQVINGYLGFIVRAQDTDNLYMIQMTTAESTFTPNNLRWHTKVAGSWQALPEPYNFDIHTDTWYHIRIEAVGNKFKVYLAETDAGRESMKLIADEWEAPAGDFAKGSIGFREAGGEHGQVDNVIVASTPGGIEKWLAVQPQGKLATLWGSVKSR